MRYKIIGFVMRVLLVLIITFGILHLMGQETQETQETQTTGEESKTVEPPETANEEETPPAQSPETGVPEGPVVNYSIEAQLLPEARKLMGSEILIWLNTSENPVDHLRFHLYYNAFRSEKTTFLRESAYYRKSKSTLAGLKFGEIRITEFQVIGAAGGETLTDKIRFISPDDANEDDRTVMEVPLEKPVEPGQSINLKIVFQLTIPEIFARTGQEGDYFFMAQWFPKIGVLQRDGLWNCHQFHKNSEFFADFGRYNVNITLPEEFVLGATGRP